MYIEIETGVAIYIAGAVAIVATMRAVLGVLKKGKK